MGFERELQLARTAAVAAGQIALRYRANGFTTEKKEDASPVTIADRESEKTIAALLTERFPNDGILGEEGARRESRNGRRWIVDPIDGTRDFVRGNPFWSVLIGFEVNGDVAAGVAHFPATGDMYFGIRGGGAYHNDAPLHVSSVKSIADAVVCVNGFNYSAKMPYAPRLIGWLSHFWSVRSFGGCQDAVMLAAGQVDVWLEPAAKPWDLAPLKIITEEAGGRFFNLDGGASIYGDNCVTCAPGLEAELRAFLAGA